MLIISRGLPIVIGYAAKDGGSNWPHRQGECDSDGHCRDGCTEFLGHIAEHEDHQEEIERIECPTEETGNHHLPGTIVIAHRSSPIDRHNQFDGSSDLPAEVSMSSALACDADQDARNEYRDTEIKVGA